MNGGDVDDRRRWTDDELIDLHARLLTPADEAALRDRIRGDDKARQFLEALGATQRQLAEYGQRNFSPRPVDFSMRFLSSEANDDAIAASAEHRATAARRRWLLPVAITAAVALLVTGVVLIGVLPKPPGGTAAPPDTTPTSMSQTSPNEIVSVPTDRPDLARLDLQVTSIPSVQVYFGRLSQIAVILQRASDSQIDPAFLAANGDVCAETVLAVGAPGTTGAIYALNLTGWSAAEAAPAQVIPPPPGGIHQQTIIPPPRLAPGTTLTGAVRIVTDLADRTSPPFTLILIREDPPLQTWSVGATRVTCRPLT